MDNKFSILFSLSSQLTIMNSRSEIDTFYAPASPDFQEEELGLDHVLSVLAESKWLILLVSLLVFLASGAYIWIAAPEYEANALIQVEKQQNSADEALRDILSPLSMGETAFSTQIGILKFRLVLGTSRYLFDSGGNLFGRGVYLFRRGR